VEEKLEISSNSSFLQLTLDEPVLSSFVVGVHQRLTLAHMIRRLVQDAVLESLSQDAQDRVVDEFVASPLLVGFEHTHLVVDVALVDGGNATELFVVPRILLAVWLDDFFYGTRRKLRNFNFHVDLVGERLKTLIHHQLVVSLTNHRSNCDFYVEFSF
jgi:hypothetical protein